MKITVQLDDQALWPIQSSVYSGTSLALLKVPFLRNVFNVPSITSFLHFCLVNTGYLQSFVNSRVI